MEVSRRTEELGPTDTVKAYYDALVNREAEKAKALLAPGFDWNGQLDASLLTSGVLRDPGYHPPRDVRLHEVRRDPDTMAHLDPGVTVVMAEYTAAGQPYRQDFTLNPHDGDPPHNWQIANPLLPLEVPRETGALLVAGSLIRPSSAGRGFIAFPGAYTVTVPRQEFVDAKPVTLITGPTDRPPFKPTLLAAGRAKIERQVRAQLDSCLHGTWVPPEECPFHDSVNTHAPAITPETSPRIIKYPTLQFETGEWGDLRVNTASPGQVEFNPQISPPTTRRIVRDFIVIGRARLTGDTISFTRI